MKGLLGAAKRSRQRSRQYKTSGQGTSRILGFELALEPYHIAKLYDPEYLQRWVEARRRTADPFSEPSLRLQRFLDVVQAGGVLTETDIESGEVIDQWDVDPQPGDRPLN